MYKGPDSKPYMGIHPPWPLFVIELCKMGIFKKEKIIEDASKSIGWNI